MASLSLLRVPLLEATLPWVVARALESQLDGTVEIDSVAVLEAPWNAPWQVELRGVRFLSLEGRTSVTVDTARFVTRPPTELSLSANAVIAARFRSVLVNVAPGSNSSPPRLDVQLPHPLPVPPFAVEVAALTVRTPTHTLAGPVSLAAGELELEIHCTPPLTPNGARIRIEARATPDSLEGLSLLVDPEDLEIYGDLWWTESETYHFEADASHDAGTLEIRADLPTRAGQLTELTIEGVIDRPRSLARRLAFSEEPLPSRLSLDVYAALDAGHLSTTAQLHSLYGSLTATGDFDENGELAVLVESRQFELATWLQRYAPEWAPEGVLSSTIEVSGPWHSPRVRGELTVRDASMTWRDERLHLDRVHLEAHLDELLVIESIEAELLGGRALGSGSLGSVESATEVRIRFEDFDLSRLRPFLPETRRLAGSVHGTAQISGPWNAPRYRVEASVERGEIALVDSPERLSEIEARVGFDGTALEILSLGGRTRDCSHRAGATPRHKREPPPEAAPAPPPPRARPGPRRHAGSRRPARVRDPRTAPE